MFELYTERARRTIFFARFEASEFGSPTIDTEHLLLGLLRENKELREHFGATEGGIAAVRKRIETAAPVRAKTSTSVDLPLSDASKRVLAYAAEAAERMMDSKIRTKHLMLGLLHEGNCLAAEILRETGLR